MKDFVRLADETDFCFLKVKTKQTEFDVSAVADVCVLSGTETEAN